MENIRRGGLQISVILLGGSLRIFLQLVSVGFRLFKCGLFLENRLLASFIRLLAPGAANSSVQDAILLGRLFDGCLNSFASLLDADELVGIGRRQTASDTVIHFPADIMIIRILTCLV